MPETVITPEQMPTDTHIACSFCGYQDGDEPEDVIIIVGTMGANICQPCVQRCLQAIISAKTQPKEGS